MDTYSILREFADSWFLIFMFSFFIGTGIWAFWPSQKPARDEAAGIPFRDEIVTCDQNCAACACNTDFLKEVKNG
ncbi:MAG: cbb3-type cytochrome c oxidase subunit 3 [Pseudomonadota bacterium]